VTQVSVADPPGGILGGVTVNRKILGSRASTVNCAVAVTEADWFWAVMVYVVVFAGETLMEPDAETFPMPGLIEIEVAP
jgi:hypothetical protein